MLTQPACPPSSSIADSSYSISHTTAAAAAVLKSMGIAAPDFVARARKMKEQQQGELEAKRKNNIKRGPATADSSAGQPNKQQSAVYRGDDGR